MDYKNVLAIVAGILSIWGYYPYIKAILKKETKPIKVTWLIWAVLDTVIFFGMISQGVINGQTIGMMCGIWVIFVLSLKFGLPGWKWIDKLCLIGAIIGLVVWPLCSATTAVVVSLIVVIIGSIPTFISCWEDPTRENRESWTIYWFSCIFNTIAIREISVDDIAQPASAFLVGSIMMWLLWFRPRK